MFVHIVISSVRAIEAMMLPRQPQPLKYPKNMSPSRRGDWSPSRFVAHAQGAPAAEAVSEMPEEPTSCAEFREQIEKRENEIEDVHVLAFRIELHRGSEGKG